MKEKLQGEGLLAGFGPFLQQHFEFGGSPEATRRLLSRAIRTPLVCDPQTLDMAMRGVLPDEQMRGVFNSLGPDHFAVFTKIPDQISIFEQMLNLGVAENRRTLSLGCGLGQFEIYLASQGPIRKEIVGVDFASLTLRRARAIARSLRVQNIRFREADACDITYQKQFEQVWIIEVLHFMRRWGVCIQRAAEALKNGGKLFICDTRNSLSPPFQDMDLKDVLTQNGMRIENAFKTRNGEITRLIITARKESPPLPI